MRTVLCSTTAGRGAFLLALVAGTVGRQFLAPRPPRQRMPPLDERRHACTSCEPPPHATRAATGSGRQSLGPAVKYVRHADGTIREVR